MKRLVLVLIVLTLALDLAACQNKKGPINSSLPAPARGLRTIYFDFDDSTIRSDQVSAMEGNAASIKNGSRANIEGHCDERGTNEYNLALGDRRAQAARNYLTNLGVDPGKLSTVSFGEERPVCQESDESCWWQNRRAEFTR